MASFYGAALDPPQHEGCGGHQWSVDPTRSLSAVLTIAPVALTELAEKGANVETLRQPVQSFSRRMMELEVYTLCDASYDEKNPIERINICNGYRGSVLEDAGRHCRVARANAAPGQLLPWQSEATAHHREGPAPSSGWLRVRRAHPLG